MILPSGKTVKKEGFRPSRMEYLQETQKYPGFIHILSTGGNIALKRFSGLIHCFHSFYCFYDWYIFYICISSALK